MLPVTKCTDPNCTLIDHCQQINKLYAQMCCALLDLSHETIPSKNDNGCRDFIVPGYNDYAKELHCEAIGVINHCFTSKVKYFTCKVKCFTRKVKCCTRKTKRFTRKVNRFTDGFMREKIAFTRKVSRFTDGFMREKIAFTRKTLALTRKTFYFTRKTVSFTLKQCIKI